MWQVFFLLFLTLILCNGDGFVRLDGTSVAVRTLGDGTWDGGLSTGTVGLFFTLGTKSLDVFCVAMADVWEQMLASLIRSVTSELPTCSNGVSGDGCVRA